MPERGSKRQRCQPSEQLLEFFRLDPNDFLSRLVTMEETWLYHYDPEAWHSSSPRPKKFRVQKSAGKILASIFWDQDRILLIDYTGQQRFWPMRKNVCFCCIFGR